MQTVEFHIMSVARPKGDKPCSAVSVRKVTSYGCAFVRENSVNCTEKTQYNLLGLLLSASMLQYTTRFFSLWITEQWRFVSIITESRKRQFCMAWLVRCCRLFRAAEPTLSFNEKKNSLYVRDLTFDTFQRKILCITQMRRLLLVFAVAPRTRLKLCLGTLVAGVCISEFVANNKNQVSFF